MTDDQSNAEDVISYLFSNQFSTVDTTASQYDQPYSYATTTSQSFPYTSVPYTQPANYDSTYVQEQYSPQHFPNQPISAPSDQFSSHQMSSASRHPSTESYATPATSPANTSSLPPTSLNQTYLPPAPPSDNFKHSEYSSAIRAPMRYPHSTLIPLDQSVWGPASQDSAHYSHSDFTPHMYRGR
jgi:hypothetical protein